MTENRATILIVDDCREQREVYRHYLLEDSRYKYRILEQDKGKTALELCLLVNPDAILLDYVLPDIDGLEFLSELRNKTGQTELPVVMITGHGDESVAVAAIKNGAYDYLVKSKITPDNLCFAVHKILDRQRLNNLLQQSQQQFQACVETMVDLLVIFKSVRDENGKIVDFVIEYVNYFATNNNQLIREINVEKRVLELLPVHRTTGLFEECCKVVETGIPWIKEAFIFSEIYQGKEIKKVYDIRAAKLGDGLVATWRNMTETKQVEQRLRLLESVVVNANDAIFIAESSVGEEDTRIIYVNESLTRITGYTPSEIVGKSPLFLLGEKTNESKIAAIRDALRNKQSVTEEIITYRKDGGKFWAEISITPVTDEAKELNHFVGIERDISGRKEIQEALGQSEEKFRQLTENIEAAFWIITAKKTELVYVSPGYEKIWGRSCNSMYSAPKSWQEGIHLDDRQRLLEGLAKQIEGEYEEEYRIVRPDGQIRWVNTRAFPIKNDQGEVYRIAGISQDITFRKKAEDFLQESLHLIQQITETIPELLYIYDVQEQRYITVNKQSEVLLGYTPAEIKAMGNNVVKVIIHPDDLSWLLESYKKLEFSSEGQICEIEYRMRQKNGEWRWFCSRNTVFSRSDDGKLKQILGTASDVTERKQNEEMLFLYADIFAYAELGLNVNEGSEGIIKMLNPACAKMFGYAVEEMIGKPIIEYFAPECREDVPAFFRLVDEIGYGTFESKHIRRDGSVFPVSIDFTSIKDEEGNLLYRIINIQDITERKRIEAERDWLLVQEQEARTRAEDANKAKDDFLSMVSHELRNPLNAILGNSQLLRMKRLNEVASKRAFETIERNVKLQSQLIDDLLDISRMTAGTLHLNLNPINLVPVIEAAIETVKLTAESKNIEINFIVEACSSLVLADVNRLQQVMVNLLFNSIKFTPEKGQVCIQAYEKNNQFHIAVTDTGIGISPEFLPYVFERFRQGDTTTHKGGLGLGLAITRHLVELHGGTVIAQSQGRGHGAVFTVRLPLIYSNDYVPKEERDSDLNLKDIKVLIVDDDMDIRDCLACMIEGYQAQVITAACATEAIEIIKTKRPDILISDIEMPDMDGYMMLSAIRLLSPNLGGKIPAIALTAYADKVDKNEVVNFGFQKCILKPVKAEDLAAIISEVMTEFRQENC